MLQMIVPHLSIKFGVTTIQIASKHRGHQRPNIQTEISNSCLSQDEKLGVNEPVNTFMHEVLKVKQVQSEAR